MVGSATRRGRVVLGAAVAVAVAACGSDETPAEPEALLRFDDARPGDVVGLAVDDERRIVTWADRIDGTIHELSVDEPEAEPTTVATIDVGIESQQGGLLDQAFLATGERALVWTTVDGNELVLGTLPRDGDPTIRWSAGEAGDGAIGGKLAVSGDDLLLAIGRNTAWDEASGVGGAVLRFDRGLDEEPTVISTGYTNPWAIGTVGSAGDEIWVWDNAAGDDPDDASREDDERIGRADLIADRNDMTRSDGPDRAPAALAALPDGRLGVCGFLDNELRAYEIVDGATAERSELERAGTIMPCNTSVAVFDDGTIVTAAQTVDGESLQILRP